MTRNGGSLPVPDGYVPTRRGPFGTIPGDLDLVTLAEVRHLLAGDATGRVQR